MSPSRFLANTVLPAPIIVILAIVKVPFVRLLPLLYLTVPDDVNSIIAPPVRRTSRRSLASLASPSLPVKYFLLSRFSGSCGSDVENTCSYRTGVFQTQPHPGPLLQGEGEIGFRV